MAWLLDFEGKLRQSSRDSESFLAGSEALLGDSGAGLLLFLWIFLDFSIGLALSGSWFFSNIAGEYFWTFLPVGFRMKVISYWSLG